MNTDTTKTAVIPMADPEAEFFADPRKATRLPVPEINGWVEVRDEVSIGEERRIFAGAVKGQTQTADGTSRMEYDAEKVSFGTTALHVVDWSFKRKYSVDALKALKPSYYKAIDAVVQAHIDRVKEGNAQTLLESSASQTSASAS